MPFRAADPGSRIVSQVSESRFGTSLRNRCLCRAQEIVRVHPPVSQFRNHPVGAAFRKHDTPPVRACTGHGQRIALCHAWSPQIRIPAIVQLFGTPHNGPR